MPKVTPTNPTTLIYGFDSKTDNYILEKDLPSSPEQKTIPFSLELILHIFNPKKHENLSILTDCRMFFETTVPHPRINAKCGLVQLTTFQQMKVSQNQATTSSSQMHYFVLGCDTSDANSLTLLGNQLSQYYNHETPHKVALICYNTKNDQNNLISDTELIKFSQSNNLDLVIKGSIHSAIEICTELLAEQYIENSSDIIPQSLFESKMKILATLRQLRFTKSRDKWKELKDALVDVINEKSGTAQQNALVAYEEPLKMQYNANSFFLETKESKSWNKVKHLATDIEHAAIPKFSTGSIITPRNNR